jgi:hypothetical protein
VRRSPPPTPAAVLLALLLALALLGPAAALAQLETPVPGPPATPLASPPAAPPADLAGVAPLPLTGERRAAFEAYVAEAMDRLGVPGGLLRTWRVWNVSEVTDPVTGEARRLSGQHPYDWEVKFSQDLTRWRSTWGLEAYGSFQETYYRINEIQRVEYDTFYMAFLEHRPSPTLSIRGELANFTGRENRLLRTLYAGPRDVAAVDVRESRSRAFAPFFHLRVRKTFGG